MENRRIVLHPRTREKLKRKARRCRDADMRTRYLIVLRADEGCSGRKIAAALGCCCATVIDQREDNGSRKVSEWYVDVVRWILASTPQEFFHRRPTWTQELLIETAAAYTGVAVSRRTMGRVLEGLKVRRGRPKPTAPCPWSLARKNRRLAMIRAVLETLSPDEACVWEDEVDIDLNPRIGFDYMLPGTQRQVPTPGKNVKRYLAGAMDAASDRLVWAKGEKKNSGLFIDMLKKLLAAYADKQVIHVILDNYIIHSSSQTRTWLAEYGEKFRLHFLPPYCPDDNRIERCVWRDMHANVTTNHRCGTIGELLGEVVHYLTTRNRRIKVDVSELRPAI
jgi:transposase